MYSVFLISSNDDLPRNILAPVSSVISVRARQQGLTVPMGLVSRLIQGSTQNLEWGIFIEQYFKFGQRNEQPF
jgi:hypothetical protein